MTLQKKLNGTTLQRTYQTAITSSLMLPMYPQSNLNLDAPPIHGLTIGELLAGGTLLAGLSALVYTGIRHFYKKHQAKKDQSHRDSRALSSRTPSQYSSGTYASRRKDKGDETPFVDAGSSLTDLVADLVDPALNNSFLQRNLHQEELERSQNYQHPVPQHHPLLEAEEPKRPHTHQDHSHQHFGSSHSHIDSHSSHDSGGYDCGSSGSSDCGGGCDGGGGGGD
ncbi:MAG: hypothetical protein AABY00_00645 [Nanoarchaeota archaeon]